MSLNKLKNVEVNVKTINNVGVENSFPFKEVELKDTEDLDLNFMFPPKIT